VFLELLNTSILLAYRKINVDKECARLLHFIGLFLQTCILPPLIMHGLPRGLFGIRLADHSILHYAHYQYTHFLQKYTQPIKTVLQKLCNVYTDILARAQRSD
jgi:hypothetical protein